MYGKGNVGTINEDGFQAVIMDLIDRKILSFSDEDNKLNLKLTDKYNPSELEDYERDVIRLIRGFEVDGVIDLNSIEGQLSSSMRAQAFLDDFNLFKSDFKALHVEPIMDELFDDNGYKLPDEIEDELLEVYSSMNKYGDTTGSQKYANSGMWENKVLADKFKLGINKIMDSAVVTPGMEKARAFRDPILSTVLQFKTFIMSSTTRTLVPALQNARDYNTAVGLMFGLTLGMLSVAAKDGLSGKTDRAPGDYITEGFAASGIAGWTELPYTIVNAMTRGGFDKAMYAATGGFLGKESMTPVESERILLQQLGPSFGKIRNLFGFIGDVSSGKIKESSMYKLKSLIPFQNTIYLDWILRQVLLGWSYNK